MGAFNPQTEELTTIVPDSREAFGPGFEQGSVVKGASTTTRIQDSAIASIYFRYEDRLVTCELYRTGDELLLHACCPRCCNPIQVSSKRKQVHWDGHHFSSEPFTCTWELENEREVNRQENVQIINNGLCNLTIALDKCGTTPTTAGRAIRG